MSFFENEDVLDRLHVQYNQDGFPDSIDESFDESYDESYDEGAEFLPLPGIGNLISRGINAAGNLLNRATNTSVNLAGVRPGAVNTNALNAASNLVGSITNAAGRSFPVRIPGAASADNVRQLIEAQNANIRKISETVNKNASETAKIAAEINRVDSKHTAASKEQNKILDRINSQTSKTGQRVNTLGRQVVRLEKNLKDAQSQTQMMALMPLLLNNDPKLKSFDILDPNTGNPVTVNVSNAKNEEQNDNTFLLLAMMMGGFGGGSGSNDMMMPMLLLAMK